MALNWDKFGNPWSFGSFNLDRENTHYQQKGNIEFEGCGEVVAEGEIEFEGCGEVVADEILDRLPADPFGMKMKSTFNATITDWFQDFEKEFGSNFSGFGVQESGKNIGDHKFVTGLNWFCNGNMRFQEEKGSLKIDEIPIKFGSFNGFGIDHGLNYNGFVLNRNLGNFICCDKAKGLQDCGRVTFGGGDQEGGGAPNDALFFALGYLGMRDVLVVERVCKSLRDAIRSDPLLWRSIHIDQPLSERITDDALVKLTSRAQGTLQCLSLVQCKLITDDGLKCVLECNPRLIKLSVPGCVRLSVEGILLNLRAFRSTGTPGIKYLRIGGLFGITNEQFEELKFLLGADNQIKLKSQKPHFYCGGKLYLSCDDDRVIDVEMCPKCEKLRLVYDCPAESCQGKHHASQLCRACTFCIARCYNCGRCIKNCDYEETFCLDLLCFNCWNNKEPSAKSDSSSSCSIFHQEMRYQLYMFG